jgi:hypothetical protein
MRAVRRAGVFCSIRLSSCCHSPERFLAEGHGGGATIQAVALNAAADDGTDGNQPRRPPLFKNPPIFLFL